MSSDWETKARDYIREQALTIREHLGIAKSTDASPFQEFIIPLLGGLMDGSADVGPTTSHEVISRMTASQQEDADEWAEFLWMFFLAIEHTSADEAHSRLAALLRAVAQPPPIDSLPGPEAKKIALIPRLSSLETFGIISRDCWNGPSRHTQPPAAALAAWVNLNRFYAHLSRQQRREPLDSLKDWVEVFGKYTISCGLERESDNDVRDYAWPAAVWLEIAGSDIYNDPHWGGRDNTLPEGAPRDLRWDVWAQRLQEIAASDRFDAQQPQLKEVAGRVADMMRESKAKGMDA
ncbi:Uu.00g141760.m01.CDS01 [Anthostomella pinea]|uniref:Uu.00g141760.m01.CDS01 n=1 Tax=Anthostomella pinea TaxID=933095 RepID=A0AAI8VQE6_9PEZI|nr:Uu.00g141760.m01.CDS01 [Anthostomella pinea]